MCIHVYIISALLGTFAHWITTIHINTQCINTVSVEVSQPDWLTDWLTLSSSVSVLDHNEHTARAQNIKQKL